MATRAGRLAVLVTRTLLHAQAGAAEAQAALLIALRQAKKANVQRGDPKTNEEAERIAREFFVQAEAEEREAN